MRGMVEAGPTRSGHRTPAVIVEAPVNGIDAAHVRYNAWQFRQILGRGAHGILLCQAETADAVRAFIESCRYPHNIIGVDPERSRRRWRGWRARSARRTAAPIVAGRKLLGIGTRGRGSESDGRAGLGAVDRRLYGTLRSLAAQPERRAAARREAGKPRRRRQLRGDSGRARPRLCRDRPGRPQPCARLSHHAARTVSAGNAARAGPYSCGLPQQGVAFLQGCTPDNIVARIDEGVRVVARPQRGDREQGQGASEADDGGVESFVIASVAKQCRWPLRQGLDCFVASLLAMTKL